MKQFSEMQVQWQKACQDDPDLLGVLNDKLPPLLNHPDIDFVRQGMDILADLDGLLLILESRGGVVELKSEYSKNHRAIEKCVLEQVSQPRSDWFGVFESGGFDGMLFRVFGEGDWSKLSEALQYRLLLEVKRMISIPEKNYALGKYQVTQALWQSVMDNNPSWFKGSSRPVEKVTWFDGIAFCNALSEREGLDPAYVLNGTVLECDFTASGYRLPTEWEWWFAASAGQNLPYAGSEHVGNVAWYQRNSRRTTHGVGQKAPNGVGLYDMCGNVWEWCWDWYGGELTDTPIEGATGRSTGTDRVLRGGGWYTMADESRVSSRYWGDASYKRTGQGFRLCRTIASSNAL